MSSVVRSKTCFAQAYTDFSALTVKSFSASRGSVPKKGLIWKLSVCLPEEWVDSKSSACIVCTLHTMATWARKFVEVNYSSVSRDAVKNL